MIFIHELGHYLMARAMGVGIEKFSIGFGKPIFKFRVKEVQWQIGWLPLGGFVSLKGEDHSEAADSEDSFTAKPWWKRALVVFAGPFANLILGLLLFIVAFLLPISTSDHSPVIFEAKGIFGDVFAPGDSIISVNDVPIQGYIQALGELSSKKNNRIILKRDSLTVAIQLPGSQVDSLLGSVSPMMSTRVGEVYAGMPAWRAGIRENDVITRVDSVEVSDWYRMRELITKSPGKKVKLTLLREGKELMREVVLEENEVLGSEKLIGISNYQPVKDVYRFSFGEAIVQGSSYALNFVISNYTGLFKIIAKPDQLAKNVGGPVMIATMSTQVGSRGVAHLIMFFASISLVLMIMNLLPIPVLDGGHIFFFIIEGIFRKPVPLKVQAILQRIGLALLVLLMLFAFSSDLSKLFMRLLSR
jgi:regulator of sigma E protease